MNSQISKGLDLKSAAEFAIDYGKKKGVDQAEVSLHQGIGVTVTARQQELETVEKHNEAQLIVSVYNDKKTGSASSSDLSERGISSTIDAAISIATHTGADECFGLADEELMATELSSLELYHPWDAEVSDLLDIALRCEKSALDADKLITNTEGASVNSYSGNSVYANSHGFINDTSGSQYSTSCSVIGEQEGAMQRDYWYDSNRNPLKLQSPESIGLMSAQRTVRRLGARKIASTQADVLFEPSAAKTLLSHLIGAIKGGAIYKKASFMLDKIGQPVLPEFLTIAENPHKLGAPGSARHDGEGVATSKYRAIMQSTANSGGVRNLSVSNTGQDFSELLAQMGSGLVVTELIGSGINMVTGDYSRGAAGFWVENGQIQFPVEEITIAGNLLEMYQNIAAVGKDIDHRGNTECGSILVENMTIAGS